ncbi:unnamed protein product [Larinioides sclopetarius]|uniref:Uncharacterized protein n=1 Tax=Larinioides sclopetarius TaxID=280406 RepID=A0AAV1Z4F4_9ARAC
MDGVGGALKRMADTLVARGIDIIDMDYLLKNLKENGTTVNLYKIGYADIENFNEKPKSIPQISNMMQQHQIIWNASDKKKITMQDLSCFSCIQRDVCSHFMTKKRHVLINNNNSKCKLKYPDRHSSNSLSDAESDSDNPPFNTIKNITLNDYVVIKLTGKKSVRFYVGEIISQDAFDEYTIKFMTKCGKG